MTFTANNDGSYQDYETGSTWEILGSAKAGPLRGENIIALLHDPTLGLFGLLLYLDEGYWIEIER